MCPLSENLTVHKTRTSSSTIMHYLKHDLGYRSVQSWAIQHRQSISPLTAELAKYVVGGLPLVVSSIAVLSAAELTTIFGGDSRLVAVAEKIDTRRTTALGDLHWGTLKLLAPVFGTWATATPVDSSKAEDVAKLRAERDSLRERMAVMMMDLTMLRNCQAESTAPVPDIVAAEIPPAAMDAVVSDGKPDTAIAPSHAEAGEAPLPPVEFPEGPALWEAVEQWFRDRFPLQSSFLCGAKLVQLDDDSLFLSAPVELPPAVVAGIEDGLMAVGLRHRECFVMVEPAEEHPIPIASDPVAAAAAYRANQEPVEAVAVMPIAALVTNICTRGHKWETPAPSSGCPRCASGSSEFDLPGKKGTDVFPNSSLGDNVVSRKRARNAVAVV